MHEHTNGVSDRPILRLGDLVPDTRPVVVTRDGRDTILKGYVWGRRIPRSIEARVRQAYEDLPKSIEVRTINGEIQVDSGGEPLTDVKFNMGDYQDMLTRVACGLVEGLSPLEAEVLSYEEIRTLLGYLEYLKVPASAEEEPERPLAGATQTSTGETSPSASARPSPDSPGASS